MTAAGRYRLVRKIGAGGMAEVYEAMAVGEGGVERRVAVKKLLAEHAGEAAFGRMFLDEARIASRLHHPGIVGVVDYGAWDGVPFQVMEFVDGDDARHLVKRGLDAGRPLPVELALHIVAETARALDHAHRATGEDGRPLGIVHRDVSPANILVGWDAQVRLTDFGIAFAKERAEKTQTGMAKGTPMFMAPEQALLGTMDGRTDLFSLGCVLHWLVVGRSPLQGDGGLAFWTGGPLDVAAELPEDVRAIVARACARERSERFPDAAVMAEAVEGALAARVPGDPRGRLRDWLAVVRPSERKPAAKLDALLDVGLLLGQEATERDEAAREAEPPRRRIWPWVIAASLIAAGGGWAYWQFGRAPEAVAVAVADAVTVADAAAVTDSVTVAVASDAAPPDATVVVVHASNHHKEQPPATRGWLAVKGEGVMHAQIFLDGDRIAEAPWKDSIPTGKHKIELVLPDGRHVGPKIIEVTPAHTVVKPLGYP